MKKSALWQLLMLAIALTAATACNDDKTEETPEPAPLSTKIMVISDVHLFDPSLLVADGAAFQTYLMQDRKLLKESKSIAQSVIATIKAQKPGLLLIPGDLTKDGEKVSHQTLASMLEELRSAGIKVLVINGNHDINNPHAMEFNGDIQTPVPSVTPEEFKSIYNNFGYSDAIARDANSISYVSEPIAGLRVVALDVCHYNPQETAGSISAETLAWAVTQITEAKAAGKVVLGMMHHGLLEHYTGQKQLFSEYVIEDWENVSATLSAAGLEVMFTGHYHAQDIAMREIAGKKIYDVETGATVTWPCPYRMISLNEKTLTITSAHIETIADAVPGGIPFQTYAHDYLANGLTNIAAFMLASPPYNVPQEYAMAVAPSFRNGFVAHYAGDEAPTATNLQEVQTVMTISADLGMALGSLWTDTTPADNTFTLTLQ